MNELEYQMLEADLRKLRAAKAPDTLLTRLARAKPQARSTIQRAENATPASSWFWGRVLLRWLPPIAAVSALALTAIVAVRKGEHRETPAVAAVQAPTSAHETLNADEVVIDHDLVSSFDAVAELPTGEPVRFECREWAERVMFRDTGKGIAVERSRPRLEVLPVALEVY
jgi:hypothetical protein